MNLHEWCVNNNRRDLLDQWDYDKNKNLTPEDVTNGVNQKVWWHLPYNDPKTGKHFDFEWEATIASRVKGRGCPYLSGKAVRAGFNDLKTVNPELAAEWHPTKNEDLTPEMVTAGSNKKVWWLLPYDDPETGKHFDFEWEAEVYNRNNDRNCPFLTGRAVWTGFNDLATKRPDLAAQWHPTKNGDLTPCNVTENSHQKVWWLYPYDDPETGKHFDFEWEATVGARYKADGCPFLSNQRIWAGYNDLATIRPDLAAEWHPVKNGDLTPHDVTAGSNKKVWWKLHYDDSATGNHFDFEWETTIGNRYKGDGCPFLSGKRIWTGFNDLATTRPDLAAEWHPTKNGDLTPYDVTSGIDKKVWWLLPYDDPDTGKHFDFEWEARINARNKGDGCPFLSGSSVEKFIYSILLQNDINFTTEKTFKETGKYRFDIFIPEYNIIIEPDGVQHFTNRFSLPAHNWEENIKRDSLKNQFCLDNNIKILRIPYIYDIKKDKDKFEKLITDFIKTRKVPEDILEFYKQFEFHNYYQIATELNKNEE